MTIDFAALRGFAEAFKTFDKLLPDSKSPKAVPYWETAAQNAVADVSTVNQDTLAGVFGVLESAACREIDDQLKLILVGVHRKLSKLKDRSWDSIMQFFSQCALLRASPNTEINHCRTLPIARTNWFKSTDTYKDVIPGVHAWLKELIEDPDVITARADVDLKAVEKIVAHAGNIMDGLSLHYRRERGERKILDVGIIRYPDISHPYIKVYRIELFAWFDSRSIAGHSTDNNGIYGQFNAKSYVPNETVTAKISSSVVDKAVREAEDLFL